MERYGEMFHDFPRLAKESGFSFLQRPTRLNWKLVENLNLEEIAESRQFDVLERCLDLVLTCDLDGDATKILDRDFLKLFRVSQLGISYLSYCLSYLDRCVILLQDQLNAAVEGQKRTHEGRRKKQIQLFECKLCDKNFITETYLNSHQRRRHAPATSNTGIQTDATFLNVIEKEDNESKATQTDKYSLVDCGVQTEISRIKTSATQTDQRSQEDNVSSQGVDAHFNKMQVLFQDFLKELNCRLGSGDSAAINAQLSALMGETKPFFVPCLMNCCHHLQSQITDTNIKQGPDQIKPVPAPRRSSQNEAKKSEQDSKCAENKQPSPSITPENFQLVPKPKKQKFDLKTSSLPGFSIKNIAPDSDTDSTDVDKTPDYIETLKKPLGNTISNEIGPRTTEIVEVSVRPDRLPRPDANMNMLSVFAADNDDERIENLTNSGGKRGPTSDALPREESPSVLDLMLDDEVEMIDANKAETDETYMVKSSASRRLAFSTENATQGSDYTVSQLSIGTPDVERTSQNSKREKSLLSNKRWSSPKVIGLMKKSWTSLYSAVSTPTANFGGDLPTRLQQLNVDPTWLGIPDETLRRCLSALAHNRSLIAKKDPALQEKRMRIEQLMEQRVKDRGELPSLENSPIKQFRHSTPQKILPSEPQMQMFHLEEPAMPRESHMYTIDSESSTEIEESVMATTTDVAELRELPSSSMELRTINKLAIPQPMKPILTKSSSSSSIESTIVQPAPPKPEGKRVMFADKLVMDDAVEESSSSSDWDLPIH